MQHNRVVVAGASGLIGGALTASLLRDGIEVTRLVRGVPRARGEVAWFPGERPLDPAVVGSADAVVVLNGASIGRLPWTPAYRRTLRESRLGPVATAAAAVGELGDAGPILVTASAVGYYGSVPGAILTESSPAGTTFLARLCLDWEAAAGGLPPEQVAFLRTAPLVHREAVLKPLILLTRLGLGGPIGPGTQVWPWITLADEVRAIRHVIDKRLSGAVNLCGPTPATADELGRRLARRMRRPYGLPAPEFALRALLGRDATESLLTADADVRPTVLMSTGFEFRHETVSQAVEAAVSR